MKKQIRLMMICLFLALTSGAVIADAQVANGGPFTLDQSVVANGGGASADAGHTYKVEGTAAQHAAGTLTRQSPFSQMGGFWPATLLNTPTAAPAAISGRITTNDGFPVAGVLLTLSGSRQTRAISDSNGVYAFSTADVGGFYTVIPSLANYTFTPSNRSFSLVANKTDAIFSATPDAVPTANPLDTAEYFVRQQYLDVLGREPDAGGLIFWSDQINQCLSEPPAIAGGSSGRTRDDCVRTQRINVAASFFMATEFQQSGSFIYNVYSAALSRKPMFAEYSMDRQQVVGGASLEAAKTVFALSFVQRPEFLTKYQNATTAESFVGTLLQSVQSSGVDLSGKGNNLISIFNGGADQTQSRALVLRAIADDDTFKVAAYNQAFVLTEYFGYLRRDPDAAGYDFWLHVLNLAEPGNYHGMVCSFITSAEYQRRFSTVVTRDNNQCGQ